MFDYSSFKDDTVFLVTGCAGFIGSHLAENLSKNGFKVVGVDDLSNGSKNNMNEFINYPNFSFYQFDIRDYNTILKVSKNVDFILHQAAWGSVPRSIKLPLDYEEINVKGTLNIFEAARINGVKRVVYASSSSVYGDSSSLPKIEGSEGNLLSPYALTKKINEDFGSMYYSLYGLETIGLRYFNVFGPRQNPNGDYAAVIPKIAKLIFNDQIPTIYGDGTQTRDFTYIDNVIQANLKACLAQSKSLGKAFNIAFGEKTAINEVFDFIVKFANKPYIHPNFDQTRLGDIKYSYADISKSREYLDFKPTINFSQGLQLYLEMIL